MHSCRVYVLTKLWLEPIVNGLFTITISYFFCFNYGKITNHPPVLVLAVYGRTAEAVFYKCVEDSSSYSSPSRFSAQADTQWMWCTLTQVLYRVRFRHTEWKPPHSFRPSKFMMKSFLSKKIKATSGGFFNNFFKLSSLSFLRSVARAEAGN